MKLTLISDTHGETKWVDDINQCDILIHAGDICPDYWKGLWCRKDLGRSSLWLREVLLPKIQALVDSGIIKHFVATLGNHDWVTRREAESLSSEHIHFLVDKEVEILGLRIWGSPWSNQFFDWAWMNEPEKLAPLYEMIPANIDILVSHQPPISCGSIYEDLEAGRIERVGSDELDVQLSRIKPRLVVCGHIHLGHGIYDHESGCKVINAAWLDDHYQPTNPIETFEL